MHRAGITGDDILHRGDPPEVGSNDMRRDDDLTAVLVQLPLAQSADRQFLDDAGAFTCIPSMHDDSKRTKLLDR